MKDGKLIRRRSVELSLVEEDKSQYIYIYSRPKLTALNK